MTTSHERGRLQTSEELRSITARYWAAFRRGDVETILARSSMMAGITFIVTDESEYIDDPDAFAHYTELEFEALPTFPLGDAQIEAWSEGAVGWASAPTPVTFRGARTRSGAAARSR